MESINISELEYILENSDDFTETLNLYVDIVYTDNGFDFIPKNDLNIIDDEGNELYRHEHSLGLKDRRGFITNPNMQWTTISLGSSSNLFRGVNQLINPLKKWVINIEHKSRMNTFYKKKNSKNYRKMIISCGDSWLQHPLNKDIIDALEVKDQSLAIYCVAQAGRELREIIRDKEYVSPLKTEDVKSFIFSAGGNDLLDDISLFVQHFDANKTPKQHLNDDYYAKLKQLEHWYTEVFSNIHLHNSNVDKIIVHSYAYPIPVKKGDGRSGKWIGKNLAQKRNIVDHNFQKEIMKHMIDDLYTLLYNISRQKPFSNTVELFDFRHHLPNPTQWYDEIHPNKISNQTLANLIHPKL